MTALALFDFDGTITDAESFPAFIRFAARPLRQLVGGVALAPLIAGYKLKLVPAGRVTAREVANAERVVATKGALEKLQEALT